jgi:hypothetical protein
VGNKKPTSIRCKRTHPLFVSLIEHHDPFLQRRGPFSVLCQSSSLLLLPCLIAWVEILLVGHHGICQMQQFAGRSAASHLHWLASSS